MNDEFAVVPLAGKVRVMALELSPQYGPDVRLPVYWSFADFKNYHHKLVGSGRSAIGAGAWWLQQQERRQYRGVVYAPNQDVPEFFNLWRGFAIGPAPGYCDLYLQHLLEVICAGNEAHFAYLLDWMAYTIQNPDKPGRTVIVLKGGEGVGKGAAVEPFRRMFGPHFRLADKSSHLVGKFNAHLWCCSFIFADEATFAGDRSIDGALKSLVTSPTLTIEPKGFEQIQVPNCLSVVMASNNDWVVPAGPDARRFFMLVVSSHRRGDDAYFASLRSELENGGAPALLDMLLKRDVSRFDHERDMPATEALEMQKAYSRRGIDALIDYLTDEGELPHAFKHEPWSASTKGALNNPPTGFYEAARKIAPDLRRMSDRTIKRELIANWE
ncbi:MAG TPA: primase-helicase family protein, partial [Burkholderiales bacterium]|nr:primase-helicase family protein [Burkholderiales bacterium]